MTDVQRTPVAIVGAGPVGIMLALFLDRYGIESVLFNAEPTMEDKPRGNTHNARTMEHYRRLGISGQIRRLGPPADHTLDIAYFTRYSGFELSRLTLPSGVSVPSPGCLAGLPGVSRPGPALASWWP